MLIVDGKKYPGEWKNDLPASTKVIPESNRNSGGKNRVSQR